MRFKILFLVGLLLTSCASATSSYKNRENEDIYIDFASVFDFKSDYYCYFHLDGCEACSYLTPKIEIKARESNNIYVVDALVDYNAGYRRDDIIGVDNVNNITFVGFPCLYYISNQKIEAIFIGVKEITNELF